MPSEQNRVGFSDLIFARYGIRIAPGKGKGTCPQCGHKTFSITAADDYGRCWRPVCDFRLDPRVQARKMTKCEGLVDQVWDWLVWAKTQPIGQTARDYLVNQRLVHETVFNLAPIGVVPEPSAVDFVTPLAELVEEYRPRYEALAAREHLTKEQKEMIEALEALMLEAERALHAAKILQECPGWIAFRFDRDGGISAFQLREPFTKKILTAKLKKAPGLFGGSMATQPHGPVLPELDGTTLVTEGPITLLSVQSLLIRNGYGFNHGVAVGGVTTADFEELDCVQSDLLVFADHDDAGFQFVDNLRQRVTFDALTSPGRDTDVDDFIASYRSDWSDGLAAFLELLATKTRMFRTPDSMRSEIVGIQADPQLNATVTREAVIRVLFDDLIRRGRFFVDRYQNAYFFDGERKALWDLSSEGSGFSRYLSERAVFAADRSSGPIVEALVTIARDIGDPAEPRRFAHWDREAALYIKNGPSRMFKVTEDAVEQHDNGHDGVLFVDSGADEPVVPGDPQDRLRELFDGLPPEQQLLGLMVVLNLFFAESAETRPLIVFHGVKGSGKTSTLRRIGWLLHGAEFQVVAAPAKPDDFDALITSQAHAFVDNLDRAPRWLEDKLAVAATGGRITRRRLFTTNEFVSYRVDATIGITTRNLGFARDDVVDRAVILNFVRRTDFVSESKLKGWAIDKRPALWAEVLAALQRVIAILLRPSGGVDLPYRMADFAEVAMAVGEALGYSPAECRVALDSMVVRQERSALDGSGTYTALLIFLEETGAGNGRYTAGELLIELNRIVQAHRLALRDTDPQTPQAMGLWLREHNEKLIELHGMEIDIAAHARKKAYRFPGKEVRSIGECGVLMSPAYSPNKTDEKSMN